MSEIFSGKGRTATPPQLGRGTVLCSRTLQQGRRAGGEVRGGGGVRYWTEESEVRRREEVDQEVWADVSHPSYNRLFLPFMFGPLDLICS